ncbi:hypothetical protein JZO73_05715 [Enterococcus plantarum]|uniref:hypothetical protein n=1 Tax=Enterococcus plantarum TaxID=1077675 RepID=UPI001A8C2703|nr:hypothetical protein [Enterococcus plantarum]MBO0467029.1 hypothetical protein [Enterococcus plantarum]
MKRNAYLLCVVIILGALMISGCSSKKQTGPVEHQQLTWHEKRDKPFGTFDYPKITENEAFDLLENKFKVKIPKFISQVKGMLQNDVMTEGVQTGVSEYTMYASSVELKVRAYYPLNEGNELSVFALVDLKYSFNKEKKRSPIDFAKSFNDNLR